MHRREMKEEEEEKRDLSGGCLRAWCRGKKESARGGKKSADYSPAAV